MPAAWVEARSSAGQGCGGPITGTAETRWLQPYRLRAEPGRTCRRGIAERGDRRDPPDHRTALAACPHRRSRVHSGRGRSGRRRCDRHLAGRGGTAPAPPEHRQAIVEAYLRQRPHAEIAAEAGMPLGTIRRLGLLRAEGAAPDDGRDGVQL
ncbi:sigma factor-like helix-turn-helix DNA-binding protein [Pseudonocardia parietis]|uniref:sigma factor-like helix-turn-helix DNA-binding protein n=1 Tax=Pseudonocardia parietis TaxID=570936 RepID=UPI003555D623